MISVTLALSLLGISLAPTTSQPMAPVCPVGMQTARNFDVNKFGGFWYVQAKYFDPTQKDAKCITVDYTPNEDKTISITMSGFDATMRSTKRGSAVARIPDAANASKLKIKFPALKTVSESDYWIVDTDNKNYGIAFSCKQLSPHSTRIRSWILTRDPYPSDKVMDVAVRAAHSHGIKTGLYELVDHADCWT